MEPSECLREAGLMSRILAATVVGYDVIMVNMFMFTMKSKGLLKNTKVGRGAGAADGALLFSCVFFF